MLRGRAKIIKILIKLMKKDKRLTRQKRLEFVRELSPLLFAETDEFLNKLLKDLIKRGIKRYKTPPRRQG